MGLKIVGAIAVAVFAASAFSPLPNHLFALSAVAPRVGSADAIVVLGGALRPDGALNDDSLRRAIHGLVLYKAGLAPVLVFSGATPDRRVRFELARRLGIATQEIIASPGGANTTREEAQLVKTALEPRGAKRILLVTDSQHLARARPLFERVGFDVMPAPIVGPPVGSRHPDERLAVMSAVAREWLARSYYRVIGGS